MNLLDRMYDLDREELAYECALVSFVGLKNIAKNATRTFFGKALGLSNSLLKMVGSEPLPASDYADVGREVNLLMTEYLAKEKEELAEILRQKIVERLKNASESNKLETDDAISSAMIDEASLLYKITDDIMPFEAIDEISEHFQKDYLTIIYKQLLSEGEKEAVLTDKKMFDAIVSLSYEQKTALKYALNVPDFSGASISRGLRNKGGYRMLVRITSYIGYDIFDNTRILTQFVYSDIWGAIRPERSLMAYLIWRLMDRGREKLRIKDDTLPSFCADKERVRALEREEKSRDIKLAYEKASSESLRLKKSAREKSLMLAEFRKKLEVLGKKRIEYKEKYEGYMKSLEEAKKESEIANQTLDSYVASVNDLDKTSSEYKKKVSDARAASKRQSDLERSIENLSSDIRKFFAQYSDCESKVTRLESELAELKVQQENFATREKRCKEEYDRDLELSSFDLKTKWYMTFDDITWGDAVIKDVASGFVLSEILNIERALKELSMAESIEDYGHAKKGKDDGYMHMTIKLSAQNKAHIAYRAADEPSKKLFVATIKNGY
ncbi:MAG TPA: hypothetical protein DEO82_06185 [Eubacterium sp.]|nr:hypothetical protein [Eubacterium sp.]